LFKFPSEFTPSARRLFAQDRARPAALLASHEQVAPAIATLADDQFLSARPISWQKST
jgi:hypothetical protein